MSNPKRSEPALRLIREIQARGVQRFEFANGGRHPRLTFEWSGETITVFFPGSGSDRRGMANAVSWLRRKMRQVEERTARGFPPA